MGCSRAFLRLSRARNRSVYIPAQQQKGNRSPRAGGEDVRDRLLVNPTPGELQQTGEEEGEEDQRQDLRRDIDRQRPQQGDPEFGVSRTHPAVCPSKEQSNACKPDIRVAGEVCDETSHNQRESSPIRDAARAQVVQAEEERV